MGHKAFFLEDVLMQTDYLKEIGADTGGVGGGGSRGGLLGGTGMEGLEDGGGAESYDCSLCGKAGFRCVCKPVYACVWVFGFVCILRYGIWAHILSPSRCINKVRSKKSSVLRVQASATFRKEGPRELGSSILPLCCVCVVCVCMCVCVYFFF